MLITDHLRLETPFKRREYDKNYLIKNRILIKWSTCMQVIVDNIHYNSKAYFVECLQFAINHMQKKTIKVSLFTSNTTISITWMIYIWHWNMDFISVNKEDPSSRPEPSFWTPLYGRDHWGYWHSFLLGHPIERDCTCTLYIQAR